MRNFVLLIVGVAAALLVTGCGKSGGGSKNKGSVAVNSCPAGYTYSDIYNQCVVGTGVQCPVGQVSTSQYGCLAQAHCQPGYGWNGSTCVYGDANQWGGGNQWGGAGSQYNGYWGNYNPYTPNYGYGGQWGGGAQFQMRYCYWFYGQMVCN